MADSEELSGRIVRIDKNYANIEVSGRVGNARLDASAARRITGSYISDIRDILENNARLKVKIELMSEETLSKIPPKIRQAVRRNSTWEVKFFRRDIEPAPLPSQFNVPEQYFQDSGSSSGLPRDTVGRVISALLQITFILNNIGLSKLLPLVKSHFKVKGIPSIGLYLGTEGGLESFIRSFPQYFTISSRIVKRCRGFSDEVFNPAITKKALEICPASTAGRSDKPTLGLAAAASAASEPVDFSDVLCRTKIIESVEECKRVLDPILDKAKSETVVIGLDCEGVKLGSEKGCLTLVQISTFEGKAFLFDAFKNPQLLKGNSSLKKILEHNSILKVIHDCKSDTYSLYHGFGVTLKNVFDTSIAMRTLMEQLNRYRSFRIGFKALCELLGEGVSHKDDDFVKKMLETPDFWKIRPFTEEMIYYAASDALCLVPSVYRKLNGMLTPLWRDLFTWSCKDTMESIQKPRQVGGNRSNTQRTSGSNTQRTSGINTQRTSGINTQRTSGSSSTSHRSHSPSFFRYNYYDDDDDDDDDDYCSYSDDGPDTVRDIIDNYSDYSD